MGTEKNGAPSSFDWAANEAEIAMRLKRVRKAKNMSQMTVAKMIGVSRTAYLKYESGKGGIPSKALYQLADIFDTTTDYLLCRTHSKAAERRAPEHAAEEPTRVEYVKRSPACIELISLINRMNEDAIEIMGGIAKVIIGRGGRKAEP